MKDNKKIFVTQPSLAPLEKYTKYLEKIWDTGVMTHNGPFCEKAFQYM